MSPSAIRFDRVAVHRAGNRVRLGHGFTLEDFSPGVTIVFGPNGSGKSTTALAMQALLWQAEVSELAQAILEADVLHGNDLLQIRLEGSHVEVTRNGAPANLDVGPVEHRRRYRLALDELLFVENDEEFATAIARASQGGYDVAKTADRLGFTRSPSSPKKLAESAKRAQSDVRSVQSRQVAVLNEAARIGHLRARLEHSRSAQRLAADLNAARNVVEARYDVDRVSKALAQFDPRLEHFVGSERKRLKGFDDEVDSLQKTRASEQSRLHQAQEQLRESGLPEEGLDRDVLRTAEAALSDLRTLDADLGRARQDHTKAEAEEQDLLHRLAPQITPETLHQLDHIGHQLPMEFARHADRLRAHRTDLNHRRRRLEHLPEPTNGVERFERNAIVKGLDALSLWLASTAQARNVIVHPLWPTVVALVLITLLAGTLALVEHPVWLLALVPAVVLAVASRGRSGSRVPDMNPSTADLRREDYLRTGLPEPPEWRSNVVAQHLAHIAELLQEREAWERHQQEVVDLRGEETNLKLGEERLQQRRVQVEKRLGLKINLEDEWLPVFLEQLARWQKARDAAHAARADVERQEGSRGTLLERANDALGTYGYSVCKSTSEAEETLGDLKDRVHRHGEAVHMRDEAKRMLNVTIDPKLEALQDQKQSLLDELGVGPDKAHHVDALLDDLPSYKDVQSDLRNKTVILDSKKSEFSGPPELLEMPIEELSRRIGEADETAGLVEELVTEIAQIERDVETAKGGHDLADALEERDAATDALASARNTNRAAAVGSVVADWVRHTSIDQTRPAVYTRASELLSTFTNGSLALDLDEQATPPKILGRSGPNTARPMQELSVGERIQALTAVRIAFLEQDERYRMPLLVDEALATADDARATAIIDTLADLARDGRQIVYLTAQSDELVKWEARLKEMGVRFAIVDLITAAANAKVKRQPLPEAPPPQPDPPRPDGRDYLTYGRALGVAAVDPLVEEVDDLHLWHVFEDGEILHKVLCRGVRTYGQLKNIIDAAGCESVDLDQGTWRAAKVAARALDAAMRAWRLGRGGAVDRSVLENSRHVSDTKLDEVSDLASELGGDASALLKALEDRRVSNWRQAKTDALRNYFEEHGLLPDSAPLERDEIRHRVASAVVQDVASGDIDIERIDRIISMLPE